MLIYLYCISNISGFKHRELFQLLCSSEIYSFMWVCFVFENVLTFLTLKNAPGSSYIFPSLIPRVRNFSMKTRFFTMEMVLEKKIWVLGVPAANGATHDSF